MALGDDLMRIPNMKDDFYGKIQQRYDVPGIMNIGDPGAANVAMPMVMPDILNPDKSEEILAESLAAARKTPPDMGMIAQALAAAIPGSPQRGQAPGGTGGSFGMAPQFQMQVNPFQQPPATGTTNPNLGNLLKGITA